MTAGQPASMPSLGRWLWSTGIGWVLGIPFTAVLALIGESVGIGGSQVIVGAGMGAGVGLLQARAVRRLALKPVAWFLSCVVGLAVPFLVWDIASVLGAGWTYELLTCVALGGLLVGCWQAALLRRRLSHPALWVATSAVGWTLAGAMASVSDTLIQSRSIHGLGGAGAYLGLIVLGGFILGLVTGLALVRGWRPPAA